MSSTLTLARRIRDGASLPQTCIQHTRHVAGCERCKELARIRARARHQAASYGWIPTARIPAQEAQTHIRQLQEQHGMSLRLIAQLSGLTAPGLRSIADGSTRNSKPHTVAAILAVKPAPPRTRAGTRPAIGAARRLQALAYACYDSVDIAPMLATNGNVVRRWRAGNLAYITAHWYEAIRDLTSELHGTQGTSKRAHAHAVRQGWVPLAAWENIDDPAGSPTNPDDAGGWVDHTAIELALQGQRVRLTPLERHHAAHHGRAAGMPLGAIATALHLSYAQARQLTATALPEYGLAA